MKRPATYVLDSTVLIDSGKGQEPARGWLLSVGQTIARTVISAISVGEVMAGTPPGDRDRTVAFLRSMDVWPVTEEIAYRAGVLRYDLARRGFDLKLADAVIAATAQSAGAVLVTANVRDFQRLGLPLVRPGD